MNPKIVSETTTDSGKLTTHEEPITLERIIKFEYTDRNGIRNTRIVLPRERRELYFGTLAVHGPGKTIDTIPIDGHKAPGWFLQGFDLEYKSIYSFRLSAMENIRVCDEETFTQLVKAQSTTTITPPDSSGPSDSGKE